MLSWILLQLPLCNEFMGIMSLFQCQIQVRYREVWLQSLSLTWGRTGSKWTIDGQKSRNRKQQGKDLTSEAAGTTFRTHSVSTLIQSLHVAYHSTILHSTSPLYITLLWTTPRLILYPPHSIASHCRLNHNLQMHIHNWHIACSTRST